MLRAFSAFRLLGKETVQLLIDDSFSGCGKLSHNRFSSFHSKKRDFDCFKQVRALENSR